MHRIIRPIVRSGESESAFKLEKKIPFHRVPPEQFLTAHFGAVSVPLFLVEYLSGAVDTCD